MGNPWERRTRSIDWLGQIAGVCKLSGDPMPNRERSYNCNIEIKVLKSNQPGQFRVFYGGFLRSNFSILLTVP